MPDMVNIYCAVIRSVVEYASPVFSDLPAVLCCALERMQKRALSIILPGVSYQEALCQSGLAPLEVRRAESCVNFMKSVKSGNPLLPICEGLLVNNESKYNLRQRFVMHIVLLIRVLRCTYNPASWLQLVLINKLQLLRRLNYW